MSAEGQNASGSMSGETPSLVGQVLGGRYRLVKKLGEGGMGEVYAAEHVHIDKKFALKLLRPEIVSNKEAVSRFYQEARSSSSIGHRNIIGVEDFGELPDGRLYMCMELLNGAPLNDMIMQPQPMDRLLNIMIQTGHGLAAAHAKNIVHRDMKPENIYVTVGPNNDDIPKLLDFGIAKVAGNEGQNNLTRTGTIFGTPFYMAPEQALGNPVDARTDVYAMGVIMYEVFAGSLPFQGESFMGILTQHITTEPEPVAQRAGKAGRPLPPGLADVITRCMQKDPNVRFQTMDELVASLVSIYRGVAGAGMSTYMEAFPVSPSTSHPIATPPPRTGSHRPHTAPTMGVGGPPPGMNQGGWQTPPPVQAIGPSGSGPGVQQAGASASGVYAGDSVIAPKKGSAGLIFAIIALLAVGGGIAAFVVLSNKDDSGSGSGAGSGSVAGNDPGSGSGSAQVGSTTPDAAVVSTPDAAVASSPDAAVASSSPDAAVASTPDAAVAVGSGSDAKDPDNGEGSGSQTVVTPPPVDAGPPVAKVTKVELLAPSGVKSFEVHENGKLVSSDGTIEVTEGQKREVVLKASGYKDLKLTIDGSKTALRVDFKKIQTTPTQPTGPKCTGTAVDVKDPKCKTKYCKANPKDPRCIEFE